MIRLFRRLLPVIGWLFAFPLNPVVATELPGAEWPLLQEAVELWLDDNDSDSLTLMAELALEGNTAARLLLARIETTDRAFGDFQR